ncbi:MAG: Gfo/Idh/MocA family oxidoreductase [Saprospiraceae bacterium]|nr:Gfo/Idh/MocA family oxidoreductase [Saprospiraceae bacterium]
MKTYRMAIVGTGSISHHFAKSIHDLENATLVAVCSSTAERAQQAVAAFGVAAFHSVEKMLAEKDIDVVCICTHSGNHLHPAMEAAKAGKHIISEKPMEINMIRAQEMIDVCEENGVTLACIFQNRYASDYLALKKAVRTGRLGKILVGNAYIKWYRDDAYYANSDWRGTLAGDGGAALINQGIHTIDLLLDIMGGVEEVYAKTRTMTHDIEGEDVALAMLTFDNGALGAIQASTSMWPGYPERLEIYGEKGSIILEGGKITAWNIQGEEKKAEVEHSTVATGSSDPMAISYHLHRTQIKNILEAIDAGKSPEVDGEEALKSIRLLERIYQSSREGHSV